MTKDTPNHIFTERCLFGNFSERYLTPFRNHAGNVKPRDGPQTHRVVMLFLDELHNSAVGTFNAELGREYKTYSVLLIYQCQRI